MLDAISAGRMTTPQGAVILGVTPQAMYRYLHMLGMSWPHHKTGPKEGKSHHKIDASMKCARCKMLLAEAPAGRDGICGYCYGEIVGAIDNGDAWKRIH